MVQKIRRDSAGPAAIAQESLQRASGCRSAILFSQGAALTHAPVRRVGTAALGCPLERSSTRWKSGHSWPRSSRDQKMSAAEPPRRRIFCCNLFASLKACSPLGLASSLPAPLSHRLDFRSRNMEELQKLIVVFGSGPLKLPMPPVHVVFAEIRGLHD